MPRYTLSDTLSALGSVSGFRIRSVVRLTPIEEDYGLVLSERPGVPGVLGLGAIDRQGDATALGLSVDEVTELRDALDRWLEDTETARYPAAAPDPWTDPDAAAAAQPPPF